MKIFRNLINTLLNFMEIIGIERIIPKIELIILRSMDLIPW